MKIVTFWFQIHQKFLSKGPEMPLSLNEVILNCGNSIADAKELPQSCIDW